MSLNSCHHLYRYILLCAVLLTTCDATHAKDNDSTTSSISHGLFALTNIGPVVPTLEGKRVNLFDYPVSGVVNYMVWSGIERTPGEMNFPYLNQMAKEAERTNKKFAYGLLCGRHAPKWVYEKNGIESVNFPRADGQTTTYHLPWKTQNNKKALNTDMLDIWEKTVNAFSKHLNSLPQRDRIYYVPITGIPFESNGLEVQHRARDFPDVIQWDQESEQLWVDYCKHVVDIYINAFPNIPLGLAFTDAFGKGHRSYWQAKEIIDYAIAQAKSKNATIIPMGLWLGWDGIINSGESHPLIKQMRHFQKQGAPAIALEGGAMGSYKYKTCLHPDKQLDYALNLPTAWVQLWYFDIVYADYQDTLKTWLPRFENR